MAILTLPVDQRVIDIDSRRFASIEKAIVYPLPLASPRDLRTVVLNGRLPAVKLGPREE